MPKHHIAEDGLSVEVRGFEPLTPCMPSAQGVFQRITLNSEYRNLHKNLLTKFAKKCICAGKLLKDLLTDRESNACNGSG